MVVALQGGKAWGCSRAGFCTQDPGPRTQDPGPRTQDPGPRTQDPGPRTQDPEPRTQPRRPPAALSHKGVLRRQHTALHGAGAVGATFQRALFGVLGPRERHAQAHWPVHLPQGGGVMGPGQWRQTQCKQSAVTPLRRPAVAPPAPPTQPPAAAASLRLQRPQAAPPPVPPVAAPSAGPAVLASRRRPRRARRGRQA